MTQGGEKVSRLAHNQETAGASPAPATTSWHSYPKVYAIGHAAIRDLFLDDVVVEEKIDGSQFSFGIFGGEIKVRSKGKEMLLDAPEKMFQRAIDTVQALAPLLHDGWTYRAEYLEKAKHNVLAYDRTPDKHLILFDINTGHEQYLGYDDKRREAERIGLECIPLLHIGRVHTPDDVLKFLERTSVLGSQRVEGVVAKNYGRFTIEGKAAMGKFVSEAFKETHKGEWRAANPTGGDIIDLLIAAYRTPARWEKAAHHMRDEGKLEGSPRDIGKLIHEAQGDILAECGNEIKEELMRWAWPKIARGVIGGLPEWYKQRLLAAGFEQEAQ